jgi:hypothetical protein
MSEAAASANRPIADISVESLVDLRSAGLAPQEIHRLHQLRDCLRYFPRLEFFTNEQWCRLLFMKWRYDRGEYTRDMPHAPQPAGDESESFTI